MPTIWTTQIPTNYYYKLSNNNNHLTYKHPTDLTRHSVHHSRFGHSSSLHYIKPLFASSGSRFLTTSTQLRPSAYSHHQTNSVAATMGSPYYRDMDEPTSPGGGAHHRSRSASRPPISHSMDYPSKCLVVYALYWFSFSLSPSLLLIL